MSRYVQRGTALLIVLGLMVWVGCAASGGGGGGGGGGGPDDEPNGTPTDGNGTPTDGDGTPDDGNDNGGGGTGPASAGAAAFEANGCTACHTAQDNNFATSSVDDVTAALVGQTPHPGSEFDDLSDEDFNLITDYLVAVILGEEQLDGAADTGDEDNENAAAPDEDDNDNAAPDDDDDGDTETEAHAWFEHIWNDFDQNYSHFAVKDVDWDAVYNQYEPQFRDDLTAGEFLDRIAKMLAELRDLHTWLFDAQGQSVEVYSELAAQNYPSSDPPQYYPNGLQQMDGYPLAHGWLTDNLAYIGIDSFEGDRWEGLRTGEIDDLFAVYADADGLVLDVRRNNGGNELVAQALAGHLTTTSYVYGYDRTKNPGPDHNDFGDFNEHRLEPAENQLFLKPIACLIGQMNLSSAEWWVLMMREHPDGITLIGDTTRGSSGSPQEFKLDNGIAYYIPIWEALRADQTTPIEDVGIPPTAGFAIAPEESYTDDRDFVLERAIELLTE